MIKIIRKSLYGFCLFVTIGLILSIIGSKGSGRFILLTPYFMSRFNNLTNAMTVYITCLGITGAICSLIAYYLHKKAWGVLIKNAIFFLVAYILVIIVALTFHIIPLTGLIYFSFGMIGGYLVLSVPKYIWIKVNVSKINKSLK